MHPSLKPFIDRLERCQIRDQYPVRRALQRLSESEEIDEVALQKVVERIERSEAIVAQKTEKALLPIDYPDLPVTGARQQILDAIQNNQVVVVAGETGSGKTTQLPKLCLELGLGCKGLIGHTQPRRLAARTVASRIADELKTELGSRVGYQVRFHDQIGEETQIKLMTDGILLAETQHDRYLNK